MNVVWCTEVLTKFAALRGVGPEKHLVVVWDRAGWQTSPRVSGPAHVHLVCLPAYSPELQPAERLWPLVNEPLANRTFADLAALETILCDRCNTLDQQAAQIRALTHFHWWPTPPENLEPSP